MAVPGQIVCQNAYLHAKLARERDRLNTSSWLYLFINDLQPTPATAVGAFIQATFTGSGPFNLAGTWTAPLKNQDGEYVITIPDQLIVCSSASNETVFGFYVRDATGLLFSGRFIDPIPVFNGASFLLQVTFVDRDFSI